MTERLASVTSDRFPRMSPPIRLAALLVSGVLAIMALGAIVGFSKAWLESGDPLSGRFVLILGAMILAAALFGGLAWRLSSYWRRDGRSSYERRYTRMWLILLLLGFPTGLLLGITDTNGVGSLFGTGDLPPYLALFTALTTAALLLVSLVLYHRTIDDHEQQAYLWANSFAFYFLCIAIPVVWLLARGGWIPPVGIETVLLILAAAIVINAAAWAWLKYR